MKECKIVCDDKEIATFDCDENGFSVKFTEQGKSMCKEFKSRCC